MGHFSIIYPLSATWELPQRQILI
ncbi:unnamed protein product, partial [Rotaria magnacalcarata]